MITVPRTLRPLVLVLLAVAFAAGDARAAVPFTDFAVGTPTARTAPVFAKDGAGVVYGAWAESDDGPIVVARIARGATAFSEHTTLPGPLDPSESGAKLASAPLLAADQAGGLTVAWATDASPGTAIVTATRRAGQAAFGGPQRVAGPQESPQFAQLGMSDDGSALINWTSGAQERGVVRRGIAGTFSAPQTILAGEPAESVAVGADGTMAAVGIREEESPNGWSTYGVAVTQVARKPAGADTFGPAEDFATGTAWPGITAGVAVAPDGSVWAHQENSIDASEQKLSLGHPGQPFRETCTLYARAFGASRGGGFVWGGPSYWARDQVHVDLQRSTTNDPCAWGSNYGATIRVPDGSDIADLVFGDGPDSVHAAWTESAGATRRVRAASVGPPLPPYQRRATTDDIVATDATFLQDATADAAGNALLSWDTTSGPRVAVVDHEPPSIDAIDLPARVAAGAALPLRASVSDAYSAPVKVRWIITTDGPVGITGLRGKTLATFDGTTATYTPPAVKPPAYVNVFVEATDSAGNVARDERTVLWERPPVVVAPTKPQLTVYASRFRVAKAAAALDAAKVRRGRGAKLAITTNVAGAATFTLTRLVPGRKQGKRCKSRAARGKRCTIERPVAGEVTRTLPAGTTELRLTGRWPTKALAPGRYRITATLTAAGKTSNGGNAAFTIQP